MSEQIDWEARAAAYDAERKPCPECGRRFHNLGSHRLVHSREPRVSKRTLHAAAPDLLAALEALLRFHDYVGAHKDGYPRKPCVCDDARAAIAKAKGEQP